MPRNLCSWPALSLLFLGSGAIADDFVLGTPGTATWETVVGPGGDRTTVFTIFDDTVFNWDQLVLGEDSGLVFSFLGGQSVTNYLLGSGPHLIGGDVIANGDLGFFSPTGDLIVTGSITANSVTLATLDGAAGAFASGADFSLTGGSGAALYVLGSVQATAGDVLLAGEQVAVFSEATINAPFGRVMMGGGSEMEILGQGDRRLSVNSTSGSVFHGGETRAGRIEIAAGLGVVNNGLLGEGLSKVFIEVGPSGRISNEAQGLIVDDRLLSGDFDSDGTVVFHPEGDASNAIADAALKIPGLTRPNGDAVSPARRMTYSTPMSATADAIRDRRGPGVGPVREERGRSLVSADSFFGKSVMRGPYAPSDGKKVRGASAGKARPDGKR